MYVFCLKYNPRFYGYTLCERRNFSANWLSGDPVPSPLDTLRQLILWPFALWQRVYLQRETMSWRKCRFYLQDGVKTQKTIWTCYYPNFISCLLDPVYSLVLKEKFRIHMSNYGLTLLITHLYGILSYFGITDYPSLINSVGFFPSLL